MNDQALTDDVLQSSGVAFLGEDATDIYCWRLEQLVRVGYSHVIADILAMDTSIDLHVACDLLINGCRERTALLILL